MSPRWLRGAPGSHPGARHVGVLAVSLGFIASCSSGHSGPSAGPTFSPSSLSPTIDPSATLQQNLVAAYAGTYADVTAAVRQRNIHSAALARHAIPPAEYELQTDVEQYLRLDVVPVGVPALHAHVVSVDLTANPQQAILAACPGAPRLVDRSTGKPVAARALPSNPFTVTLQTTQGRWVVSYFKIDRSKNCSA